MENLERLSKLATKYETDLSDLIDTFNCRIQKNYERYSDKSKPELVEHNYRVIERYLRMNEYKRGGYSA